MTERPILFSGPMVRALLAGTKTQTRRVMKCQPTATPTAIRAHLNKACTKPVIAALWDAPEGADCACTCPYGVPGDRLWVRENGWERPERTPRMMLEGADTWAPYYFDADGETGDDLRQWGFKRRPSIHMPRWACRLALEVTGIRVERLQDISEHDAQAEGIRFSSRWEGFGDDEGRYFHCVDPRRSYEQLWGHINGADSWDANPWVWVVEFKRADPVLPKDNGNENPSR